VFIEDGTVWEHRIFPDSIGHNISACSKRPIEGDSREYISYKKAMEKTLEKMETCGLDL